MDRPTFHVHGFVKDTALLMSAADILITKPGGLTCSEALAKQLPLGAHDADSGAGRAQRAVFNEAQRRATRANTGRFAARHHGLDSPSEKNRRDAPACPAVGQAARGVGSGAFDF